MNVSSINWVSIINMFFLCVIKMLLIFYTLYNMFLKYFNFENPSIKFN